MKETAPGHIETFSPYELARIEAFAHVLEAFHYSQGLVRRSEDPSRTQVELISDDGGHSTHWADELYQATTNIMLDFINTMEAEGLHDIAWHQIQVAQEGWDNEK